MHDDKVEVDLGCGCPKGRHSDLKLSRSLLASHSLKLRRLLEDHPNYQPLELRLKDSRKGYTCHTVECLLLTWKHGKFRRVSSHSAKKVGPLEELRRLALLLHDYGCAVEKFSDYAQMVRDDKGRFERHLLNHDNALHWAYISWVFDWGEHFSRTILAIVSLEEQGKRQSSHGPDLGQKIEEAALRAILCKPAYPYDSPPEQSPGKSWERN